MKTALRALLTLALLFGVFACTAHDQTRPPMPDGSEVSVQTMIAGVDRFPEEGILSLNTGHGPFVVGPEVDEATKSMVFEKIMEYREYVMTIRYVSMPSDGDHVAHNRATSMIINGEEIQLVNK